MSTVFTAIPTPRMEMMRTLQLHHLNFPSLLSTHLTMGCQPTNPGGTDSPGPMEAMAMEAMEVMEVTPAKATILVSIPVLDLTLIIPDCRLPKLHRRKMSDIFQLTLIVMFNREIIHISYHHI